MGRPGGRPGPSVGRVMSSTTESEVTVEPAAPGEKSQFAGMMQTYLHELSIHTGQRAAGNGRYQYPYLDLYWSNDDRHPFLIRDGKSVIGFALVRQVPGGTTMAEFFIRPDARKHGHGRTAAHALFRQFPGRWAVRQMLTNSEAQAFWRSVIKDVDSHYSERIETSKDGRSGCVQRFIVPDEE